MRKVGYNAVHQALKKTPTGNGKGGRPKGSTTKATRAVVGNGHVAGQHGFISAAFAMGLDNAQKLLDKAKQLLG
jgi:hypothetical protein